MNDLSPPNLNFWAYFVLLVVSEPGWRFWRSPYWSSFNIFVTFVSYSQEQCLYLFVTSGTRTPIPKKRPYSNHLLPLKATSPKVLICLIPIYLMGIERTFFYRYSVSSNNWHPFYSHQQCELRSRPFNGWARASDKLLHGISLLQDEPQFSVLIAAPSRFPLATSLFILKVTSNLSPTSTAWRLKAPKLLRHLRRIADGWQIEVVSHFIRHSFISM